MAKMSHLEALIDRAEFLAAGQDDPHSVTITELCEAAKVLRDALASIARGDDSADGMAGDIARAALSLKVV